MLANNRPIASAVKHCTCLRPGAESESQIKGGFGMKPQGYIPLGSGTSMNTTFITDADDG